MKFRIQSPFKLEIAGQPTSSAVYPFLPCMVKQGLMGVAALALFGGGIMMGHYAATQWPGPRSWMALDQPLDAATLDKLRCELELTPAQEKRLAPVITAACTDLRLLSEENRARKLDLLDEISATIAPDLTPDQKRMLEAYEEESRAHTPVKRDPRIVALF